MALAFVGAPAFSQWLRSAVLPQAMSRSGSAITLSRRSGVPGGCPAIWLCDDCLVCRYFSCVCVVVSPRFCVCFLIHIPRNISYHGVLCVVGSWYRCTPLSISSFFLSSMASPHSVWKVTTASASLWSQENLRSRFWSVCVGGSWRG